MPRRRKYIRAASFLSTLRFPPSIVDRAVFIATAICAMNRNDQARSVIRRDTEFNESQW